jgi:hypothetical protein
MPDPPLTAAQRSYLRAFDRFLRNKPGAWVEMRTRLVDILDEAEERPDPRPKRFPAYRRFRRSR